MDNSSSSLSDDDRSDSWSIIDENVPEEDGIDFEIVKDLFDNNDDGESNSSEICDVNVLPTITTFPNEEIVSTNNENILTTTPNNEEDSGILIDFSPTTSSLKQRHVTKEKDPYADVEKNEPKRKCTKRKKRFYRCPFVAGVSLGTILTVCGLSLILKSSDEITPCQENTNVTAANLANALEDNTIWPSLLEEEKLIQKYCPNKFNRDFLKNKNMRSKLLKRIDRKIKQQIRGCDLKAIKNNTEKPKQTNEFIGPLPKECCIQRNDENKSHSKSNFSKPKDFNNAFIFQAACPAKTSQTNCITTSSYKKEPCSENKFALNENKTPITQVQQEKNIKSADKPINITTDNKYISKQFIGLEEFYQELKHNIIKDNYKPLQDERSKQANIVSSLENRINAIRDENLCVSDMIQEQEKQIACLQSQEESYQQLKHNIIKDYYKALQDERSKQANIVSSLENRRNAIRDENLRLSDIIQVQEKIMDCLQLKLSYKKKLIEKRNILQQNLEKHLQLIQDRKMLTAKRSLAKENDITAPAISREMSNKLLDEMILETVKNSTAKNESDHKKEYFLGNNLEHKSYGSIEKKNEYQPNIPLMKRRDVEKKPKETLDIFLGKQKLIAGKARKMADEEHVKKNNQLGKCDPQKTWIRKRNELY